MNALPLILDGQLQIGMWLKVLQIAFRPHIPGQGSMHLFRIHALEIGQSLLRTHSGRQLI